MNAIEFKGRGWLFGGLILLILLIVDLFCFGLALARGILAPVITAVVVMILMSPALVYALLPRGIILSEYGIELLVLGRRRFHAPWQEIIMVTNVGAFGKPLEKYLIIRSRYDMVRLLGGVHFGHSTLAQVFRTLAQHQKLYPHIVVVDNLGWA